MSVDDGIMWTIAVTLIMVGITIVLLIIGVALLFSGVPTNIGWGIGFTIAGLLMVGFFTKVVIDVRKG